MHDQQKLSDLPQYDAMEDEDFPPLPPPDSPGQGGQDEGDPLADGEEGELSKLAEVPAAKRKGVKRPQPKLDSQRLTSERGLPALRTLFDNVRFKGKGHEVEDLRLLMQKMENWAHRLYPKLQFEDFIDKVERLGSKKEVQTCLKRIRLDMPLTEDDFIGEEAAAPELQAFDDPDPFSALVHSTPAPAAPPPLSSPPPASLTEEQRQRMELSRQRALERRLARNQQADPSESQTVETSESEPTAAPTNDDLHAYREEEEEEKKMEQEERMEEEEDRKEQEEVEQEREEQVDSEPQQPSSED